QLDDVVGRGLHRHLVLVVALQAVGVVAVAAVGRAPAGLHVGGVPRFRPERAQEGRRVEGAGADLQVERLDQHAATVGPVRVQALDQLLEGGRRSGVRGGVRHGLGPVVQSGLVYGALPPAPFREVRMTAPSTAPFLIIETGKPVGPMQRHGDFPHWIRVAAGMSRDAAVVVDVQGGEPLPVREGFAGVIVTGSGAMVTERLDWSEATAAWLRAAAHEGLPLFGICYGHQLLAHALGGEVGNNPAGREMGTVEVELLPAASDDALLAPLPARFDAQLTHMQSVLRVPDGAIVLARSAGDPCQAFRWGKAAWGVQFH